ncbi:MAG: bacteriohemerythrin [Candidatus Eisenbacteria bacterium]|nr:bacteriohemerythrin [Candidatus Eisenbacteria bacterium]
MSRVQWDESLSIGIRVIDEQHQRWIQHLNEVASALESEEGAAHIVKTLGFLVDYTEYHFTTEEKHMAAHGYPEIEAHRAKHAELKRTLANLVQEFEEDGATQSLADAVDTLLGNWLVKHIREVDQAFGDFLQERDIVLEEGN